MRRSKVPLFDQPTLAVREWKPASVTVGFDPRSAYVERYWLGILGPAATLLIRHIAAKLDRSPHGFMLSVTDTAQALGLKAGGTNSSFQRSMARLCDFGIATAPDSGLFLIQRTLPKLSPGRLARLPAELQEHHARETQPTVPSQIQDVDLLAQLLIGLGREFAEIDTDLARWGVPVAERSEALYSLWDSAPAGVQAAQ